MNLTKVLRLSIFVIALLSGVISFMAGANCTLNTSPGRIDIPALILSPSERGTVGTVLYSTRLKVPQIGYSCGSGVSSTWRSSYSRAEMSQSALTNVYTSGLAGIGIRVKWPESRANNAWIPGSYQCQGNCIEPSDYLLIEFVQTGNVTGGTIASGNLLNINVAPVSNPQNSLTLLTVNLGLVTVNVSTCAIYASSNSIDLGDYTLSEVKASGFQGDKKDFTITLDCPASSSAQITFEGRNAWGMSSGVIANSGSAQNSYIKLYQKNIRRYTEIPLNTTITFASNFTGMRSVTYAGEMYFDESTRKSITAGSVTANIIYTLTIN